MKQYIIFLSNFTNGFNGLNGPNLNQRSRRLVIRPDGGIADEGDQENEDQTGAHASILTSGGAVPDVGNGLMSCFSARAGSC